MITPEQAMGRVNKAVSAAVRPLGFRGSKGSWYRVAPEGVTDIGTTRRSNPDGVSYGTLFVSVGIAVVPVAWWEYVNWRAARWGQAPVPFDKDATRQRIGLVEYRYRPDPSHYRMRPDPDAYPYKAMLPEDVEQASAVLGAAAGALARWAIDLSQPGRYLDELLADPDKGIGTWEPLVVLLADRGPSADLDQAIDDMHDSYGEGSDSAGSIAEYARKRAAERAH